MNIEKKHTFYSCFGFCCCESEPLILRAQIPIGGYIPGQTIDLEFEAFNKSNVRVSEFTIQFVKVSRLISLKLLDGWEKSDHYNFLQQITYTTYAKLCRPAPKLETFLISFEKRPGCDSSYEKSYQVNFVVPSVVPTCACSEIIKVDFFIRVSWSREYGESLNIRITLLSFWRF